MLWLNGLHGFRVKDPSLFVSVKKLGTEIQCEQEFLIRRPFQLGINYIENFHLGRYIVGYIWSEI